MGKLGKMVMFKLSLLMFYQVHFNDNLRCKIKNKSKHCIWRSANFWSGGSHSSHIPHEGPTMLHNEVQSQSGWRLAQSQSSAPTMWKALKLLYNYGIRTDSRIKTMRRFIRNSNGGADQTWKGHLKTAQPAPVTTTVTWKSPRASQDGTECVTEVCWL